MKLNMAYTGVAFVILQYFSSLLSGLLWTESKMSSCHYLILYIYDVLLPAFATASRLLE